MCNCIKTLDEKLKGHNTGLVFTLFGVNKVSVETYKLDSKKRGKVLKVIASYCPFCGERYSGES